MKNIKNQKFFTKSDKKYNVITSFAAFQANQKLTKDKYKKFRKEIIYFYIKQDSIEQILLDTVYCVLTTLIMATNNNQLPNNFTKTIDNYIDQFYKLHKKDLTSTEN